MFCQLRQSLLLAIGLASVATGLVGIVVPLLPTTPFLLLGAACFLRSSPRLHAWLLGHPWLGSYIRNYRERRAMTRNAKLLAIALLWTSIGYSTIWVASSWWLRLLLLAIAGGVTAHLLHLGTITQE